jgi:AcrR family transcriptional regulator
MRTQAEPDLQPNTREKILDAAESLIIERGYAATSLRAIAKRADVNLAATHYHFGSKFGLLTAVFHRRLQPVDEARLQCLDQLQRSGQPLTVRDIVEAFLSPVLQPPVVDAFGTLPNLVGRIMGEPESLTKPLLEQQFAEVARRYRNALSAVLPGVSPRDVEWRFHFLIGAMIHLLRFQAPLGSKPSDASFLEGFSRLVDFVVAGTSRT